MGGAEEQAALRKQLQPPPDLGSNLRRCAEGKGGLDTDAAAKTQPVGIMIVEIGDVHFRCRRLHHVLNIQPEFDQARQE